MAPADGARTVYPKRRVNRPQSAPPRSGTPERASDRRLPRARSGYQLPLEPPPPLRPPPPEKLLPLEREDELQEEPPLDDQPLERPPPE